ncbi:alpha-amylase family glycosyl hydrolase [Plesiocystis pacifica]|nr:alpha-amylase family glycosyl hydrolase [Plesiocystis pacifica]
MRRALDGVMTRWCAALMIVASSGSCAAEHEGPPARDCRLVVWAQPQGGGAGELRVVGSWDDWAAPGRALEARDSGWYVAGIELPAGDYGYLVVEDGAARVDALNPLTTFRAGDELEVSLARVADCGEPALAVEAVAVEGEVVHIDAQFLTARDGEMLAPASLGGSPGLEWIQPSAATGNLQASVEGLGRGRHRVALTAADAAGREASAEVSVFVDPIAARWSDGILYQVVTDRFRGPGGAYLDAPETPASRAGGTLDGVRAAIEDGSLAQLGVSALWLSPVYLNPDADRLGTDGRLYSSYHGYWVLESRTVDGRIGGEPALRELIDLAHGEGLGVVLDVIPNHVYEDHAVVPSASAAGWFNTHGHTEECVCGTPTCPWSDYQETCWFAPYLPDLRLEKPEAMDFSMAEIAWWVDEFDVDGLRIDAVSMMPRAASRRVADLLRSSAAPGSDRLLVGEVFTGGGTGGIDGLRYYLGPQGLDSVFDFPLMWSLRATLSGAEGFASLDALLDEEDAALEGSGALLARMLGNHDTPRFVSSLVGDHLGDPWDEPASQPEGADAESAAVLERAALGWTLQMTLPGMPVIYYGDELGLAGANDPDCRRVMPDPATLSPARQQLLAHARALGQLRRATPALRSSFRETLLVGADTYAYARFEADPDTTLGAGVAIVLLSRADADQSLTLPGGSVPAGRYVDALDADFEVELGEGSTQLTLGPRSSRVLVQAQR